MTFLPIAERELRVAARSLRTFQVRVLAGLAATGVALLFLAFAGRHPAALGRELFAMLSVGAFLFCLAEGVRSTADCLSEEKRDGTIGLLFLTDLRGFDVVLGKFAAAAVASFSSLLAAFPGLSLPLLAGGVTPGEFWRVMLALAVTLGCSLAAGLWVSARSVRWLRAVLATVLLLMAINLVPWIAAQQFPTQSGVLLWHPLGALQQGFEARYPGREHVYWSAIGASLALTMGWLAAAAFTLPRVWRRHEGTAEGAWWMRWLQPGGFRNPAKAALKLNENPSRWLAERTLPGRGVLWVLPALSGVATLLTVWAGAGAMTAVALIVVLFGGLLLKLWLAVLAPLAIAEARRSGALELILCTPVKSTELVSSHLEALREYILKALGLLYAPALCGMFVAVVWDDGVKDVAGTIPQVILAAAIHFGLFMLDAAAISRVGLWLGLTQRRPGQAVAKTIVYVLVLPWVTLIVPIIGCFGIVLWPAFWIHWASQRLNERFRLEVTQPPGSQPEAESWWPFARKREPQPVPCAELLPPINR